MKATLLCGLALVLVTVACNGQVAASGDPCGPGEACSATQAVSNVDGGATNADNTDNAHNSATSGFGGATYTPATPVTGTPMPAPEDTQNVPFLPSTATPGVLRVFISSTFHDGNFGGFDGADAFCRSAANAAGVGGKWAAYLTGSNITVSDHVQGDGPWYGMDGTTLIWENHDAIATDPRNQPSQDEAGRPNVPAYAWVGGQAASYLGSCADWTTTGGDGAYVFAGDPLANVTDDPCSTKHNLVCVEQL